MMNQTALGKKWMRTNRRTTWQVPGGTQKGTKHLPSYLIMQLRFKPSIIRTEVSNVTITPHFITYAWKTLMYAIHIWHFGTSKIMMERTNAKFTGLIQKRELNLGLWSNKTSTVLAIFCAHISYFFIFEICFTDSLTHKKKLFLFKFLIS